MKIALYTIFRCTNYGAVLQALALVRALRNIFGSDSVEVINHRMDPRDNHLLGKVTNPNTPWFQRWLNKRKFARRYIVSDLFEKRRQKTIMLMDELIRPTEHLYRDPSELRSLPPYDVVVVGSDQIWNPALNHDFGCNQYLAQSLPEGQSRVAYAASFGVSKLPPSCRTEYQKAISKFQRVTCREESGAEICKELLGWRPEVVLDPTLLLSAADWIDLVRDRVATISRGHIVGYWVRTVTQADVDALAAVARDRGATVRLLSAGPLPKLTFPLEVLPVVDADPLDFVAEIACSSCVITDSFHGLQFSIIFRRPFLVLGNLGNPSSNATRLVDFCRRYGLLGGVADIDLFRRGDKFPIADISSLDSRKLEADRMRSARILEEIVRG